MYIYEREDRNIAISFNKKERQYERREEILELIKSKNPFSLKDFKEVGNFYSYHDANNCFYYLRPYLTYIKQDLVTIEEGFYDERCYKVDKYLSDRDVLICSYCKYNPNIKNILSFFREIKKDISMSYTEIYEFSKKFDISERSLKALLVRFFNNTTPITKPYKIQKYFDIYRGDDTTNYIIEDKD